MAENVLPQTDITTDITFNDVFEDDDEEELKETPTVHHIRANSSIMQVKKILGMYLASRSFPPESIGPNRCLRTGANVFLVPLCSCEPW
jgi:hypothetical protein